MDDLHEQYKQHQPRRAVTDSAPNPAAEAPSQVATSHAEQVEGRAQMEEVGSTTATLLAREMGHLLDGLPDGVVITDEDGRVQLVNRQMEMLFGYEREALLGEPIELLMPRRFRSVHPTHRVNYAAQPRMRPMGTGLQLFGLRRHGDEFPVEISLSPIVVADQPLVLATIRDVSAQRLLEQHAREELAARLTMLQTILDELPISAYLARGYDAELVLSNRAVADVWGATWPEGVPMRQFLAGSRARIFDSRGRELPLEQLATMRALRSGQPVRQHQEVIRRADGTAISVLVNALSLDAQVFPYLSEVQARPTDPMPVVLVTHQDIGALVEAERLKDEFVALAAHELRNPIASLFGYAQVLLQAVGPHAGRHTGAGADTAIPKPTPAAQALHEQANHDPQAASVAPDVPQAAALAAETGTEPKAGGTESGAPAIPLEWQEEAILAVMDSSRRLTALTNDLLDATRLQANRLELRPEPLELGALIRRVVKRAQVTTYTHSIVVVVPSEPLLIYADVQRIEQVLTNLLSNAVKYSPEGGHIEVTAHLADRDTPAEDEREAGDLPMHDPDDPDDPDDLDHEEPSAQRTQPGDIARVAVRDHGIGIPTDQQTRIFGRFVRADNARERGIAGTGLGLYVCRELIERQGGRLWFESTEGAGTTFTFELPRWIEPASEDGGSV